MKGREGKSPSRRRRYHMNLSVTRDNTIDLTHSPLFCRPSPAINTEAVMTSPNKSNGRSGTNDGPYRSHSPHAGRTSNNNGNRHMQNSEVVDLSHSPYKMHLTSTEQQAIPSSSTTPQRSNGVMDPTSLSSSTFQQNYFTHEDWNGDHWDRNDEFPASNYTTTPSFTTRTSPIAQYNVHDRYRQEENRNETHDFSRQDIDCSSTPTFLRHRNNSEDVQEGYYNQRLVSSPPSLSNPTISSPITALQQSQENQQQQQHPTPTLDQETEEEKQQREEEESEALARQLMAEEAMASYQQSTQFLQNHANEYSEEDLQALQAVMAEEGGDNGGEGEQAEEEEGMDSNELSYETLLQIGERIGDVKTERWALRAKAEIEKLPTIDFKKEMAKGKDENDSSVKCLVCQFAFEEGEKLRVLPCGHHFHTECIDQWLSQKHECPYCRQSIMNDE